MMFLIIVSDGYITAQMNLAGIGSDQFIDDLQDCGLAGSVIADDRYMFALFQLKIKMFEQGKGAEGLRQIFHTKNVIAAGVLGFQLKVHVGAYLSGFVQDFDLIQHFHTAFGAADGFFPIKRPQLLNDFFLMFDLLLLLHIGTVFCGPQRFLPGGVGRVITCKDRGFRVVDLDYFVGDAVEEVAVMGYDDHCSPVV